MNNLTGKDKAVAGTLMAEGFEIANVGEDDEDFSVCSEDNFREFIQSFGGIENWSVSESEFDFYVVVEEFNSKVFFVKMVDDLEDELANTCELIRNTLVAYEAAQAQIPLFNVEEFSKLRDS